MINTRIIRLKHINTIRKTILNACSYNVGLLHPPSAFVIIVLVIVIVTMIQPILGKINLQNIPMYHFQIWI
jgi:hypothetical protein